MSQHGHSAAAHVHKSATHRIYIRSHRNAGTPTDPAKDAELILDGKTGRVLYARNADAERHPASLTKMMTLYMLFDALKKNEITLNTPIYISQHAASQSPTKLGLPAGDTIPVDVAIRAAVVLSANDIAVAIAEALGGTESHFAQLMTERARQLGMRNTFYHNASGLPDDRQITTASDLGLLARHLAYDFPQYFHYFSLSSFMYRGRTHLGHDNLLGRYAGCDGIKTGYTNGSGFNLVSSVVRNGVHVIGIVMGGRSAQRRDKEMMRLLDQTFAEIKDRPQLVAHANVPWQTLAQTSDAQPIIAGFQFGVIESKNSAPAYQSDALAQSGREQITSLAQSGQEIDEDTAESAREDDDTGNLILPVSPEPQIASSRAKPNVPPVSTPGLPSTKMFAQNGQASVSLKAQPNKSPALLESKPQIALFTPDVQPAPAPRVQIAQAAAANVAQDVKPVLRSGVESPFQSSSASQPQIPLINPIARSAVATDTSFTTLANLRPATRLGTASKIVQSAQMPSMRGWAIQIGAFADEPSAKAQLAAYASRSMDVLGKAERIVIPFEGVGGKTMYRARFGPFPEQQARAVCATLTQRGQTCFAATMTH